ncbi:TrmB family transcriptional regulator [Haloarchaeobius salinus]|uniref:TrmB family transcriptional regulator n=1 Tax=Haloarchaeobius salinus TaxID=1198298 RepID=UPI00210DF58E|nr:helix-turn-helix domain-containing protein [Haloarchaeobius salinus]
MSTDSNPDELLDKLELTEYERTALRHLIELGRSSAPDISEATGIPKARIYGVLEALADAGYVKIIPGRPKEYESKSPGQILDRAIENQRQEFDTYRQSIESIRPEFLQTFEELAADADDERSPTEELFHVVSVGTPSERETRALYNDAEEQVCVITKSFEYFESVRPSIESALDRDIAVSILFLYPEHLDSSNRDVQKEIFDEITGSYPAIETRFSKERLPWRGTIADPSMEYDSGRAVLLVEEEDIPLYKRQAAVTENASFVAGMKRYFDLVWQYDTVIEYPD